MVVTDPVDAVAIAHEVRAGGCLRRQRRHIESPHADCAAGIGEARVRVGRRAAGSVHQAQVVPDFVRQHQVRTRQPVPAHGRLARDVADACDAAAIGRAHHAIEVLAGSLGGLQGKYLVEDIAPLRAARALERVCCRCERRWTKRDVHEGRVERHHLLQRDIELRHVGGGDISGQVFHRHRHELEIERGDCPDIQWLLQPGRPGNRCPPRCFRARHCPGQRRPGCASRSSPGSPVPAGSRNCSGRPHSPPSGHSRGRRDRIRGDWRRIEPW